MRYRVRMHVRTNLLLPSDLVAEVDAIAGPRGRSRYVTKALEREVRRDRWWVEAQRTAGGWTAESHPQFETSEQVREWVRAGRAEGTEPWADD
jgi:metal-responsive CopG/Arc/MetJ family transcriptional regulator